MKYSLVRKYKYKLEADYAITISIDHDCHNSYISLDKQELLLKKGYTWDGSSVPLKRFIPKWLFDSDRYCKTASLVHDGLCQLMREGLLPKSRKEQADKIYKNMCMDGGMGKKQARLRFWALRKFGDGGIEKEKYPRNTIFEI